MGVLTFHRHSCSHHVQTVSPPTDRSIDRTPFLRNAAPRSDDRRTSIGPSIASSFFLSFFLLAPDTDPHALIRVANQLASQPGEEEEEEKRYLSLYYSRQACSGLAASSIAAATAGSTQLLTIVGSSSPSVRPHAAERTVQLCT